MTEDYGLHCSRHSCSSAYPQFLQERNKCRRLRLKCDGTRAVTRFRLSAERTNPFKSVGASVQLTTGSRGVRISGSNAGCTMFRGSVKSTGYPLHSPVSPSIPLPCITVCHHISTGLNVREFTLLVYYGRQTSLCSNNKIIQNSTPNGPLPSPQYVRNTRDYFVIHLKDQHNSN
jgi:hypothetical protein